MANGLFAAADGLIAMWMIYYLLHSRTGFKRYTHRLNSRFKCLRRQLYRTDGIICWLMAYIVNTGAITMYAQSSFLRFKTALTPISLSGSRPSQVRSRYVSYLAGKGKWSQWVSSSPYVVTEVLPLEFPLLFANVSYCHIHPVELLLISDFY